MIREHGGDVLTHAEVTEILRNNSGRVTGVCWRRHDAGQAAVHPEATILCPLVISDAGARVTFGQLLRRQIPEESELKDPGYSVLSVFLGLNAHPQTAGIHSGNHWLYDGFHLDTPEMTGASLLQGRVAAAFVSFPSVRAGNQDECKHTCEIIVPARYSDFRDWNETHWKNRPESYEAAKERMADSVMSFVLKYLPGLDKLVSYREVATPLIIAEIAGNPSGAIYGIDGDRRSGSGWNRPATDIPGLWITGTDAAGHGTAGAMMGGMMTAMAIAGAGKVFREISRAGNASK